MSVKLSALLAAGAIIISPALSRAADVTAPQTSTSTIQSTPADPVQVLTDLHHSNQMEIAMGKLAQKRGQSADVKKFGDTLVKDHTNADKKVADLAKTQAITLADAKTPANEKETQTMDRLKSLKGRAFDRAFAETMLEDHRQDREKLQAAQTALTGTPTGDLVTAILPVIQQHEQIASDLVTKLQSDINVKS